jgi:hypothetical protein
LWSPGRSRLAAIARSARTPARRGHRAGRRRRGILETAAARAVTAPARCERRRRGARAAPAKPRVRTRGSGGRCVTARPLVRLARLRVRRVPPARRRRRPGEDAAVRAPTPLHGRRCLRWQRSLSAALVACQRPSRSRASAQPPHVRRADQTRARAAAKTTSSAAPSGPTSPHGGGARISEKPRGFHRCAVANVRLLHMLVGRSGA